MKKIPIPACLTCLIMGVMLAFSQPLYANDRDLGRASAEAVGLSSEGIRELAEGLRREVDDGNLAGIVSALIRNGKLVHLEAHGYQDLENQIPVTEDTIFRIFSMTKPVTGVALMMLYDEGKFTLDDAVSRYIPELANLQAAVEDGPGGFPVT
jgi:CubicO group peptidase (beta-lactamase class C family)